MQRYTRARGTALALVLVGAVSAAGCGASDPGTAAAAPSRAPAASDPAVAPVEPPGTPAPSPRTEGTVQPAAAPGTDDGTWHALLVSAEPDALVLDKVEILSGAAAEAARAEAGDPDPGADVPYVRNDNDRLRRLPVPQDVDVEVVDCLEGGCELVPWSYADLVQGRPLPYGAPTTPFAVTVVDGSVVAVSEVYFP